MGVTLNRVGVKHRVHRYIFFSFFDHKMCSMSRLSSISMLGRYKSLVGVLGGCGWIYVSGL